MTGNVAEGTEELSEEKCWELLARERTGRLAVAIGKHPDIFPVNHVIEKRKIVFRTDPGTKLAAAVLGTGVAVCQSLRWTTSTPRAALPGASS